MDLWERIDQAVVYLLSLQSRLEIGGISYPVLRGHLQDMSLAMRTKRTSPLDVDEFGRDILYVDTPCPGKFPPSLVYQ